MKKLLITNFKGGQSKSLLAINIAACLSDNYRTCIIDLDPQGSVISFKDFLKTDVVGVEELYKDNYNVCVVDSPPYNSDKLPEMIRISDYVLIPVRPSYVDVVATKSIIQMIPKGKPCGIVLTQVPHRVNLSEVLELLQSYNVPILKQYMTQRVSYQRSAVGGSVFQSDDLKAQNEILSITLEVFMS